LLGCMDLLDWDGQRLREWADVHERPIMYVDPPWSQGNMTTFYHKADLVEARSFSALLDKVVSLGRSFCSQVWIEMGRRETARLLELLHEKGARSRVYPITYYGRNPANLVSASWQEEVAEYPSLFGMDDEKTPGEVLRLTRPAGVFDPCTGRGLTAVSAVSEKVPFLGVELNPIRAGITLEKVSDLLHMRAEQVR
jgi:hypothetical protein